MDELTVDFSGPLISVAEIGQLEQQLGCTLPEDYRDFLLKHNGGIPSKGYFFVD